MSNWPDNFKATPKNYPGLYAYRLDPKQENPQEVSFASMWLAENNSECRTHILAQLLDCDPSERDQQVAATIIQWLGSNCGMSFLHEVGRRNDKIKQWFHNV